MRTPCFLVAALLLTGSLLGGSSTPPDVGASGLAEEIERLQQLVDTTEIDKESWERVRQQVAEGLGRIAAENRAGRPFFALDRLSGVRNTLLAYLYSAQQAQPQRFDDEWRKASDRLLARAPAVPTESPAVVRALAEAARLRVRRYHSASGSMAAATSSDDGLFYLGRAHAFADFVAWSGTVRFPATPSSPSLRGLGDELDALEREVLAAYVPPRSIDRHREFIGLHASLKLARELDDAGYAFGALNQYLATVASLGVVLADPVEDAEREEIRVAIDAHLARLATEKQDHSIATLYLEMAESALGDEPERSRVIVDRVLPAYVAALAARAARSAPSEHEVTVTLVRWPYT